MSTFAKSGSMQVLYKVVLTLICALCLQSLCGCTGKSGDEGVADQALKYANARISLDMPSSSALANLPDVTVEISVESIEDSSDGKKVITLVPTIVSDTMASWKAEEWAENRDDLFFNLVAHFSVICKQANKYGDIPETYVVTNPGYVVVSNSQKNTSFVVTASGVYQKTDDPENPIGELVVSSTTS